MTDLDEFLELLGSLPDRDEPFVSALFDRSRSVTVTRAPGRLDMMGGIADYSGSLVLEMPIREATFVAAQHNDGDQVRLLSVDGDRQSRMRSAEFPLAAFQGGEAATCESARRYFARDPELAWSSYVAGNLSLLCQDFQIRPERGLSLLVSSSVPEGKGVSSSAAVEVATLQALGALYGLALEPTTLARACQRVENLVVGAPCGVMDQMTSVLGRAGELLAILCQPAEIRGFLALPEGLAIWGLDSGLTHRVSGEAYTATRVGAFMGYRLLTSLRGFAAHPGGRPGLVRVDDPVWLGYLANVTPAEFVEHYRDALPSQMSGQEFLARYGGTTDPVTVVDPEKCYAIRQATSHPVFEHQRVGRFAELLRLAPTESNRELMGELMYQSHASYSSCGLGSDGTDAIVDLVRERGPGCGLYGAKITGGGGGGTVAILGRPDAAPEIERIAEEYATMTNRKPHVFKGSSPGAAWFGALQARYDGDSWAIIQSVGAV